MQCPVCKLPFRTSHVGRCNLLPSLTSSDPRLSEDIAVYKHKLPIDYCVFDAALNHRAIANNNERIDIHSHSVGVFCYFIEQLC